MMRRRSGWPSAPASQRTPVTLSLEVIVLKHILTALCALSALFILSSCATTYPSVFKDGHQPLENASAWLVFAGCDYKYVAARKADTWGKCVGPHTPSDLERRVYGTAMSLEQVRANYDTWADSEAEAQDPVEGAGYTWQRVTHSKDGKRLGIATYGVSTDGKNGFLCWVDDMKINPDSGYIDYYGKDEAYAHCDGGLLTMAKVAAGKAP